MGWSWAGNVELFQIINYLKIFIIFNLILLGNGYDCNQSLSPLNLVQGDQSQESTWTNGVLSAWGKKLFETADIGIQATSLKASIF